MRKLHARGEWPGVGGSWGLQGDLHGVGEEGTHARGKVGRSWTLAAKEMPLSDLGEVVLKGYGGAEGDGGGEDVSHSVLVLDNSDLQASLMQV
jgi:hypothetical protein